MKGWYSKVVCGLLALLVTADSTISENEATNLIERHLEDGTNDYFEYDLANFSLRFDRCQHVKMFNDELAEDEDSESPLAIKHFVVFRLCPSDECETCSGVFGRYVAEAEDYLKYTVAEQYTAFEYMCDNCQEKCNEDGSYCSGCGKLCYRYANLEANGYVDASNYIECQQLELDNGDDDDENDGDDDFQLYIGPRCSSDGSKILIGLFSDEYCLEPYTEAEPEDYLGYNISYHLLAHTNSNDGAYCLSCQESEEDKNQNDEDDADDVNEMCEELYGEAAKCESKYGLDGFIQDSREDGEYENQVENEFMVCNFIESLIWNSYTETGDINIEGEMDVIIRDMTGLQKGAVSFLMISIVGLLGAAYFLQRKIDTSFPKIDLARQSDATLT
jgi:hypothetical protein